MTEEVGNKIEEKIVDRQMLAKSSFVDTILNRNVVMEARKRADVLRNMQGCSKCRARLENPHADFHLTAVIDSDKI